MSPRSLDPISRRPEKPADKPVESKSAKQPAKKEAAKEIPHTADRDQMLAKAQANLRAKKDKQARRRRKFVLAAVLLLATGFIAGGLMLIIRQRTSPQADYARLGDTHVSRDQASKLKDYYAHQDEQLKTKPTQDESEKRAQGSIAMYLGLMDMADKYNVDVSDAALDAALKDKYTFAGGKDSYLARQKARGADGEAQLMLDKIEALQKLLADKVKAEKQYSWTMIRWDDVRFTDDSKRQAYFASIEQKMKTQLLPLYERNASLDEIKRAVDLKPGMTYEQRTAVITGGRNLSSFESGINLVDDTNSAFVKGDPERAKAIQALQQPLAHTGVMRTNSGYYAIFRLESERAGDYSSYQALQEDYLKRLKLSSAPISLQSLRDKLVAATRQLTPTAHAINGSQLQQGPDTTGMYDPAGYFASDPGAINCLEPSDYPYSAKWDASPPADLYAVDATHHNLQTFVQVLDPNGNLVGGVRLSGSTGNTHPEPANPGCRSRNNIQVYNGVFSPYAWCPDNWWGGGGNSLRCYWTLTSYLRGASTIFTGSKQWWGQNGGNAWFDKDLSYQVKDIYQDVGGGEFNYDYQWRNPFNGQAVDEVTVDCFSTDYTFTLSGIPGQYVFDTNDPNSIDFHRGGGFANMNDDRASISPAGPNSFHMNTYNRNDGQFAFLTIHLKPNTFNVDIDRRSTEMPFNDEYFHYDTRIFAQGSTPPSFFTDPNGPYFNRYGSSGQPWKPWTADCCTYYNGQLNAAQPNVLEAYDDPSKGGSWFYNQHPGWEIYGYTWCQEGSNDGLLYQNPKDPGGRAGTAGQSGKCGWNYTGPYDHFSTQNKSTIIPAGTIDPGARVKIIYWFQPDTISLRGVKKGPGTFINQNSDTTVVGNGTVSVDGNVVSGSTGNTPSAAYSMKLGVDRNNVHTVHAQADEGWQIRGYAYCVGAIDQPDCTNDAAGGNINLQGNGQQSLDLDIDFRNPPASLNGTQIPPGQELYLVVYFKPAPIDVQARAWIDQKGGNDQKINPCDDSYQNSGDYKYDICKSSRIRAIRMNTSFAGGAGGNIAATNPTQPDTYDPVTGPGAECFDRDYIPQKPGYDYANIGGFYCARGDNGQQPAGGTSNFSDGKAIQYGQTLDVATGGTSTNGNPSENNAAIFRNVYPGKYSFEAQGTPDNGGAAGSCPSGNLSCANNPLVSPVGPGVSPNKELAYTVGQSTCDVNTTLCQNQKLVINNSGGCKLNHRRTAYYPSPLLNAPDYCTIIFTGLPESSPNFYSPDTWNPSFGWNASQPSRCTSNPLGNPWRSFWNPGTGSYGYGTNPGTDCGYPKSGATLSVYTYSMGIVPQARIGGVNTYREQNFFYAPKVKVVTDATKLTCDTYTAKVSYMPDPSRQVTSYFMFANVALRDQGGNHITLQNNPGSADPYTIQLNIPKYNHNNVGAMLPNAVLKDGNARAFSHFTRIPDSDLQSGYPQSAVDIQNGAYKYSPYLAWSGNHQCQNNATCTISNAPSSIDADSDQSYIVTVDVTNQGQSYWMENFDDSYNGKTYTGVTTDHGLMSGPGTTVDSQGKGGWQIVGISSYTDKIPLPPPPPQTTGAGPRQVYPTLPVNGPDNYGAGREQMVKYTIRVTGPVDGGKQFRLGFQMGQTLIGDTNPTEFGSDCSTNIDVVTSYKPWLRVQNGNTSALGKAYNQKDGAKGTYKSNDNPQVLSATGHAEPPVPANNDINTNSQYVVYGAVTGAVYTGTPTTDNRFCSANAYNFGRLSTGAAAYDASKKICDTGPYRFRLPAEVQSDLQAGTTTNPPEKLYDDANASYDNNSQCSDTAGSIPDEVPAQAKFYRKGRILQTTGWTDLDQFGNGALSLASFEFGSLVAAPCPAIYKYVPPDANAPKLDAMRIGAGRGTVLTDLTALGTGKPLHITGNIINDMTAQGAINLRAGGKFATATMNRLPNLGIFVKGDVVIDFNVTEIDASIYATGTIYTCDKYDDGTPSASTGSKNKITINGNSSDPANQALPPYQDQPDAKACSSKLQVKGSLVAGKGFKFGRNYMDYKSMVTRMNKLEVPYNTGSMTPGYPENNLFKWPGAPSDDERGKFCTTDAGYQCGVDHWGTCPSSSSSYYDFDAPGSVARVNRSGLAWRCSSDANPVLKIYATQYKILNYLGYPQSGYYSSPAEDIFGNGLSLMFAPPGFDNVGSDDFVRAQYNDTSSSPRF